MRLSQLQDRFVGEWAGTKKLWLSAASPEQASDSRMSIAPVAGGKFLAVRYTWSYEGEAQEGFLLVGNENRAGVATSAWGDSWHMGGKLMSSTGAVDDNGEISLAGSYEAPPDPDWGWRTVLTPQGGALRMEMYNVSPQGMEELAVRADYVRV